MTNTHVLVEGGPARLPEFLRAGELQSFETLARANKGGAWMSKAPKSSVGRRSMAAAAFKGSRT